jgi:sporulation protein YlmC with PRC-barrel domain
MKRRITTAVAAASVLLSAVTVSVGQQIVGSTQLGVAVAEVHVTTGWSARRHVLGRTVYNETGDAVGKIDDIIVAPDKVVSHAIVGAGGFLGVGRHDVAIPVSQLKEADGKFVLAGATKDPLKALPPFEYAD